MTIRIDDAIGMWGISAEWFKRQLQEASGNITIEINSPGGNVIEGIAIYNAIKDYDKGEVTTVIVGMAASMASYIALAGDIVKAYDNTIYMIHNASGATWGDYREMENYSKKLLALSAILKRRYVSKTGKGEDEIQSLMDDETYFFGQEMLDSGFIDEIISTDEIKEREEYETVAKERFSACMSNVQKNAKKEDTEQIAALINDETLRVNSASAQIKNTNPNKGDNSMGYTKEEFEALEATHAEALNTKEKDTLASERQRVSDIMALIGCEETKKKAIEEGMTVGECAIELNKKYNDQAQAQKSDFEQAAQEVAQVATGAVAEKEQTAEEKAWDDAQKEYYGGKK